MKWEKLNRKKGGKGCCNGTEQKGKGMKQTRKDDVEQYSSEQYEAEQKAIKWNKAEQRRN